MTGPTRGAATGELAAGRVIGRRYRLERPLGSGGMAQVWEATDQKLGRRVAIKILHGHMASPAAVARFRQEATAAAQFPKHPNMVSIIDGLSSEGVEAIVMELIDGTTLRRHLDRCGTLSIDDTARICAGVCGGLAVAHAYNVIHRDVKPANILLARDGRVLITDFGIAKAAEGSQLTREGMLVGTAAYLSPEQLRNEPVDARTDVYALGIVLYECLTGRLPFTGDSDAAIALARLRTTPTPPDRVRADVTTALSNTILRALARDPDQRFASMEELSQAMSVAARSSPTAEDVTREPARRGRGSSGTARPRTRSGVPAEPRRWALPALVVGLVAFALLIAVALLQDDPGKDPADRARPVDATVSAFDPQGDGQEKDERAAQAADGSPDTAWTTEGYKNRRFNIPGKTGVGVVLQPSSPITLGRLEVQSSSTGWSAMAFVLPPDASLPAFDPATATAAATVSDVRTAKVSFDLRNTPGAAVVLWITDLGEPTSDAEHRFFLNEARLFGRAGT